MEAAAFAQAAAALASMFPEIVSTTKQVIETMKGARAALMELFTRAERIRLNLELFRSLTYRLSEPMERTAAISFNESSYRQTATEVLELVRKVADSGKRSDLMMRERNQLANAAYSGDWESVPGCLEKTKSLFHEPWANAVRLRQTLNYDELSLWTPLHQAAYMRAPVTVISQLLEHGAFRTLPTGQTRGEFQYADLTPAEIAQVLGYDDIYGILAPVVRHVVPARTQTLLQAKFNEHLLSELADRAQLPAGCIRFPPLSALTELEHPEMWFPIGFLRRGFLFRLDGREVVVLSIGRARGRPRQAFRVTTTGWTALEDVVRRLN
ncbi:hypothetical protein BDW67DRAFT_188418 [Aspergillus spinulosporus]